MLLAEVTKNLYMFNFFKLICHLKEETAWGEMKAYLIDSSDSSSEASD